MASRREVVLSFALRRIKEAEDVAKRILVSVRKSTTLAKDVKRELVKGAREKLGEIRALKQSQIARERLRKRAAAARERPLEDTGFRSGLREIFGRGGAVGDAQQALSALAAGDGTGAALEVASAVGGPLVKLATTLTKQLRQYVDHQVEKRAQLLSEQFQARLEAQRYEQDYARRMEEDPAFRREQGRLAFTAAKRAEEWRAARGLAASGDFLEGF